MALNNLWSYLQGLALARSDRDWLAGKLLEATTDEARQQQLFVKDTLYRALDEVETANDERKPLQSIDDFINELQESE